MILQRNWLRGLWEVCLQKDKPLKYTGLICVTFQLLCSHLSWLNHPRHCLQFHKTYTSESQSIPEQTCSSTSLKIVPALVFTEATSSCTKLIRRPGGWAQKQHGESSQLNKTDQIFYAIPVSDVMPSSPASWMLLKCAVVGPGMLS